MAARLPRLYSSRRVITATLVLFVLITLALSGASWAGWLPSEALAQSPITAEVDRNTVLQGEQVTLTITIGGGFLDAPVPDLSEMTDFNIIGKSEATQITMINGRLSSQKSYIYRLMPRSSGSLTIPAIRVEIDGQNYETMPIEVEVLTSGTVQPPNAERPPMFRPDRMQGQNFFVEAEVDNTSPYLGQQIVYTFRLFQATNFFGQPDYRPPAFTDFWSQTILSQPRYNTILDGQDYIVTEIRTALFPASLGPTTIDPSKLIVPGGLFDPDIILETEPITVDVRSLPGGAPAEFRGAVGEFEITAEFAATEATVNEPVTFVLKIIGAGNVEILREPALPQLPNWRYFESQSSTTIETRGDVVYGTRRFERLMVPGQPGEYVFPPVTFSFYNPEAGEYRVVNSEPVSISVKPGDSEASGSVMTSSPDRQQVEIIAGDIRHIKAVPPALNTKNSSLAENPFYWGLWALPVALVGGAWLWQSRRQRLLSDYAYMRRQRARRIAFKVLDEARHANGDGYALAHRALLGYLSDRLNRPTAGLTTDRLLGILGESGLEPELVEQVRIVLDQIETSRFAPVGAPAAQSVVSEVKKLIDDLEKFFRGRS